MHWITDPPEPALVLPREAIKRIQSQRIVIPRFREVLLACDDGGGPTLISFYVGKSVAKLLEAALR